MVKATIGDAGDVRGGLTNSACRSVKSVATVAQTFEKRQKVKCDASKEKNKDSNSEV